MAIPPTHTVSVVETFQSSGTPTFVESLDAITVGQDAGMPLPPVMIYGDDVSHVVTEEGACQTGATLNAALLLDVWVMVWAVVGIWWPRQVVVG